MPKCTIDGCRKKVYENAKNNPQSLDLCKPHYAAQGHITSSKIDCMVIDCTNKSGVTGLCNKHSYDPPTVFGLIPSSKKGVILSTELKFLTQSREVGPKVNEIMSQKCFCIYCGEPSTSSLGPTPAHACFSCWEQINE